MRELSFAGFRAQEHSPLMHLHSDISSCLYTIPISAYPVFLFYWEVRMGPSITTAVPKLKEKAIM